jgi:hypothetical protein
VLKLFDKSLMKVRYKKVDKTPLVNNYSAFSIIMKVINDLHDFASDA